MPQSPVDIRRPIYVSGRVMMEDGTAPPTPVTIERMCQGRPIPEGYTDGKGRFSLELGRRLGVLPDASVGADPSLDSGIANAGRSNLGTSATQGLTERDLTGCEVRANLPGYQSTVVLLSGRRALDNPDVGTLVLRSIAGVNGYTFSATSLMGSKDSQKAYEKGHEALGKRKFADAQKELDKAVTLYPKHALAWTDLGALYAEQKDSAKAMDAFRKAVEADGRYVVPYLHMAKLYAAESKWEDAATASEKVVKLNPAGFAQAYFFLAVASYNLKRFDAAENAAREAVRLDEQHSIPRAQYLLGVVLAMKKDAAGAALNMREYLKTLPEGAEADSVRKQLAQLEGSPTAALQ
jgi:tetratricopeptide (TPR) repeat protein